MNQSHRVIIINQAFADTLSRAKRLWASTCDSVACLTVAGIGLGLAGALVGTRVLRDLLYQTQAYDPVTLAAVAGLFAVVAMGAVYWPARQAARLDPVVMLPHD